MHIRTAAYAILALWATAAATGAANAETYPNRPVTIVVPFAPGGSVDIVARPVAQALQEKFKSPFVVEYRQGANSRIATAYVGKARPDGYTLLVFSGSFMVNPSTQKDLPYDTLKDFTPVGMLGENANVLIVNPKLGVNSVQDLIKLAKSQPGKLTYGSSGAGGPLHLAAELFKSATGVDMVHVPYRGTGAMYPDLLSGVIDLAVVSIPSGISFIQGGLVKALAVTSAERVPNLPNVPTMVELGIPMRTGVPYGLVAPAGTPKEVIERLNKALAEILKSKAIKERFAAGEIDPIYAKPDETATFIRTEIDRYADVVRKAGLKPQK
jgi:tripartite-type tricarboxylate transporter receptor subunit TctC